jgi:hypothetical protein
MIHQPVRSAQWDRYTVELDIPVDADRIVIGLVLTGNGKAWFGDITLEPG